MENNDSSMGKTFAQVIGSLFSFVGIAALCAFKGSGAYQPPPKVRPAPAGKVAKVTSPSPTAGAYQWRWQPPAVKVANVASPSPASTHPWPPVPSPVVAVASVPSPLPQARFIRVHPVFDVVRTGEKGMLIQVDADVDGLHGKSVVIAAYFSFADGKPLPAIPGAGQYGSANGQVTTQAREVPLFSETRFTNGELFVPYIELTGGIVPLELQFHLEIQYNDGVANRLLARSDSQPFAIR
jgi:hypothetical protein